MDCKFTTSFSCGFNVRLFRSSVCYNSIRTVLVAMGPKGQTYAKPKCESNALDICKIFRSHYTAAPTDAFTFKDDDFAVLGKQMEFFVDLWKADPYVCESVLAAGLHKAFPHVDRATGKRISKDIKSNLALIHTKKRSMTSGLKLPVLKTFLDKFSDDSFPSPIKQPSSSSKEPGLVKAKSVAELYGFKSAPVLPEVKVSQYTISDSSDLEVEPETKVVEPEMAAGSMVVQACKGYYFDYQEMALVQYWNEGSGDFGKNHTEVGKMKAGPNGFAVASFSDGSVQETTVCNLEMIWTKGVLKRPATVPMKRPTANMSNSSSEHDDEPVKAVRKRPAGHISSSGSDAAREPAGPMDTQPGKALKYNIFELPSKHKLKIGLFTEKAYITYMAPGSDKWELLINVGSAQAARNGKNHHDIMGKVWDHTKTLTELPTKAEMKALVMSLILQV